MSQGVALNSEQKAKNAASRKFYQLIIRWHFICALIFTPLILVVTASGIIYLFEHEYENIVYQDLFFVEPDSQRLPVEQLLSRVNSEMTDLKLSNVKTNDDPTRSVEMIMRPMMRKTKPAMSMEWAGGGPNKVPMDMNMNRERVSVFVNPYTGSILGSVNSSDRLMSFMKDLHGNLLTGKIGTKFVELASCWVMVLMVTGLIMWWPRGKTKWMGTLIPRLNGNKRIFWRDLHAVPAFYFSFFIIFLVISGLPWTDVWGTGFRSVQKSLKMNAPAGFHSHVLKSTPQQGTSRISIDYVINTAKADGYGDKLNIKVPRDKMDTFAIQRVSDDPALRPSMHFDQYSGSVLGKTEWDKVPLMAKAVTYGIKLHRGEYFGTANLMLVLVTSLVLMLMAFSGLVLWLKRRPKGKVGEPKEPRNYAQTKGVIVTTVGFALFMPLLGLSLVLYMVLDLIYSSLPFRGLPYKLSKESY